MSQRDTKFERVQKVRMERYIEGLAEICVEAVKAEAQVQTPENQRAIKFNKWAPGLISMALAAFVWLVTFLVMAFEHNIAMLFDFFIAVGLGMMTFANAKQVFERKVKKLPSRVRAQGDNSYIGIGMGMPPSQALADGRCQKVAKEYELIEQWNLKVDNINDLLDRAEAGQISYQRVKAAYDIWQREQEDARLRAVQLEKLLKLGDLGDVRGEFNDATLLLELFADSEGAMSLSPAMVERMAQSASQEVDTVIPASERHRLPKEQVRAEEEVEALVPPHLRDSGKN